MTTMTSTRAAATGAEDRSGDRIRRAPGLGAVRADDGKAYPVPLHGDRRRDQERRAGTRVVFSVVAGHGGRYEARALTKVLAD